MPILFYEDTYYMLSNWSAHAIDYKGILYMTAEHAYHAQKFTDEAIRKAIQESKSPKEAKDIAYMHKDKWREDWHEIKAQIMEEIVMAKALQHAEVQDTLLATEDEEIAENSPLDYFWGIGKDRTGENQMGKIWMRVREKLRATP